MADPVKNKVMHDLINKYTRIFNNQATDDTADNSNCQALPQVAELPDEDANSLLPPHSTGAAISKKLPRDKQKKVQIEDTHTVHKKLATNTKIAGKVLLDDDSPGQDGELEEVKGTSSKKIENVEQLPIEDSKAILDMIHASQEKQGEEHPTTNVIIDGDDIMPEDMNPENGEGRGPGRDGFSKSVVFPGRKFGENDGGVDGTPAPSEIKQCWTTSSKKSAHRRMESVHFDPKSIKKILGGAKIHDQDRVVAQ